MKRFIFYLSLVCPFLAHAQTTPNLNLNIPIPGTETNNWKTLLNNNFSSLDSYLSGGTALPGLNVAANGVFANTQLNLYMQTQLNGCGGTLFSGSVYRTDAFYGCILVPTTSAVVQADGVTGYIVNKSSSTNGVGGYFIGQAASDRVSAWGANEVASDNSYLGNFNHTILYGNEVDLGVNSSTTTGYGLFLSGTASVISTHTFGVQIMRFNGSTYSPYYVGFNCGAGATTSGTCLNILPLAAGTNRQSQTIAFVSENSGGVFHATTLYNDATGNFNIGPATGLSVKVGTTVIPQTGGTVLSTGNGSGDLIQTKRTSGCATTGGALALTGACATTVTWANAFADGRYTVTCTGNGITSGVPILQGTTTITGASTVVQTQQATGVDAQFANIECMAVHD
jgi:hypothetical protein